MVAGYRNPSIVQQELKDLKDLVKKNEELIFKDPDDFSLKVNLQSLKHREEHLLNEIEDYYNHFNMSLFDLSITGEKVDGTHVSAKHLGEMLIGFQDLVTSIASSIKEGPISKGRAISQNIIEASQMDVVETVPGSFRVILSSHQPTVVDSLVKQSLDKFNELAECEDNRELIKEQIEKLGNKPIFKYKHFLYVIYRNNTNLELYSKLKPENYETKEISSELAERIHKVIEEEEKFPEEDREYRGTLKELSLIRYTFGFLVDNIEAEILIHGKFDKNLESIIENKMNKTFTAKFKYSKEIHEVEGEEKETWKLIDFVD